MQTILLAEDEPVLGKFLKEALERIAFEVLWAKDGQEAYDFYRDNNPDLCVLDVMMPRLNGFALATDIRLLSKDVPILFLSACAEPDDIVRGFESGGNDYLRKPFSLNELKVRVQELLRRNQKYPEIFKKVPNETFPLGAYQFNPVTQVLKYGERITKLTFKESLLLYSLLMYKNALTPRKEILERIWGDDSFYTSRTMDVYIGKLRRYLEHDPKLSIVNIRGFGFKLVEEF